MSGLVWLDGRIGPPAEARIDPGDRGFLLGDGIFETMRVVNGHPPLIELHLDRLAEGARLLRLSPPHRRELCQAITETIAANRLRDGALRLTLTRGPGPRGLLPPEETQETVLIATFPSTPTLPAVNLHISRQIRHGDTILSRVKTLNYLPSILARMEAQDAGADDALLLNQAGRLACASAATLVALRGDRLVTPPLSDGALPGIGRRRLLASGLCIEQEIARDLPDVRAAWLLNALSLRVVRSVGHRQFSPDRNWTARIRQCAHPA